MSQFIIRGTIASDVANSGTFTVNYPTGTNLGSFTGAVRHSFVVGQQNYVTPSGFALTFGASNITVTNNSGATWVANTPYILGLETVGKDSFIDRDSGFSPVATVPVDEVLVSLGAPAAASANAICTSQSVNSGVAATLNGASVVSGVAVLDGAAGRNVVAAWTNTAVVTVTGTDIYGNTVVESSASGTSFTGVKAFARVTSVTFNANVTGATVGTGTVLGLPVFLTGAGYITRELQDGALATAGTAVGGLRGSASTATSADVRGTYAPNSAPNGSRSYQLIIAVPDSGFRGNTQFAG